MGTREVHDGDQACRCGDRFDHLTVDIGKGLAELLPVPRWTARAWRLPVGRVMVGELDVVPVRQRQGLITHSCERIQSRLSAFGNLRSHCASPYVAPVTLSPAAIAPTAWTEHQR